MSTIVWLTRLLTATFRKVGPLAVQQLTDIVLHITVGTKFAQIQSMKSTVAATVALRRAWRADSEGQGSIG
jgi:hypothetical protein